MARLLFELEWAGQGAWVSCLFPGDEAATQRFGQGPIDPVRLPLTDSTRARMKQLSLWYQDSLNWKYPPHPGPWRQDECDRFNAAARELLALLRKELGAEFQIDDHVPKLHEDPQLDEYLRDPTNFKREEEPQPED